MNYYHKAIHLRCCWKPLTIIIKHSILDVAAALGPPLWIHFQNIHTFTNQKPLLCTLLLLGFKIVKSLHCILKHSLINFKMRNPCKSLTWFVSKYSTKFHGIYFFNESFKTTKMITTLSSRPEVFCRKDVLRNFPKFTWKHLCLVSFLIKLQA